MAYTQEQIDGARAWATGKTGAEIQSKAQELGLDSSTLGTVLGYTPEQVTSSGYGSSTGFNSDVASATWGGYTAPNVVSAVSAAPAADRFTDAQYSAARDWASGKSWAEISQKGSDLGLTSAEMGKVFGNFGGSGQQVQSLTGYGTGATGFNADGSLKYNTSFGGGVLADGSKPGDWAFDSTKGWVRATPRRAGGSSDSEMPTTGINLSNLQNASMWEVKPNQTVQSQLQQIIAADSPLMQQARARALQSANSRGLLNSSMAITAGDSALYDAAMPIAQQDASTYADAAKFNTGELNTFSRDNNAFTRDAFMADFNLKANEWAKQQDQYRMYDQLDYQQKLTLDRDAVQNGYQGARDAILNGYTVDRDYKTNAFTLQRDTNQNAFTANQAELDRVAAERRTAMGIQAPNPDTSVLRTQMQIDADKYKTDATINAQSDEREFNRRTDAQINLNKTTTEWAGKVIAINTSDLTQAQKDAALIQYTSTYGPIATSYATQAGLDPADVANVGKDLRYNAPSASNVVENVAGQTGGSDSLGNLLPTKSK